MIDPERDSKAQNMSCRQPNDMVLNIRYRRAVIDPERDSKAQNMSCRQPNDMVLNSGHHKQLRQKTH